MEAGRPRLAPAIKVDRLHDEDEDDLGEDRGKIYFPEANSARDRVRKWAIQSVGNRPRDHAVRDLLFGALQRDRRNWIFSKLVKQKPRWMMRDTFGLGDPLRMSVLKYRALHFCHLMHLARMREDADEQSTRIIERLERCWPTTVQVEWTGAGQRTTQDLCGYARHCPFCFGRRVLELYERLLAGLCHLNSGLLLWLGITSVTDTELDEICDVQAPRDRLTHVRKEFGLAMQQAAKGLGGEGGLTVFQIGPHLAQKPVWHGNERALQEQIGFNYRIAVLAGVPAVAARELYAGGSFDMSDLDVRMACHDRGLLDRVEWHLLSAANPGEMRRAVFGCPPSSKSNTSVQEGLFAFQPWMLANFRQWQEHLELTRHQHLFDTWGSWKTALPAAPRAESPPSMVNAPTRRGKYRGRLALQGKNQERQDNASARRVALLPNVQGLLAGLHGDQQPLGRVELKRLLHARGYQVSDRDCRWLVRHLSTNST